jgi:hypothetical protein
MKFLHTVWEHPSWNSRAKIQVLSEEKAVAILDGLKMPFLLPQKRF